MKNWEAVSDIIVKFLNGTNVLSLFNPKRRQKKVFWIMPILYIIWRFLSFVCDSGFQSVTHPYKINESFLKQLGFQSVQQLFRKSIPSLFTSTSVMILPAALSSYLSQILKKLFFHYSVFRLLCPLVMTALAYMASRGCWLLTRSLGHDYAPPRTSPTRPVIQPASTRTQSACLGSYGAAVMQ